MPPELLGPTGLLVACLLVIAALWKEHLKADQDDRDQRDKAMVITADLAAGNLKMGNAWEERNREDANRQRRDDR